MRQYRPWRWIIVINMCAVALMSVADSICAAEPTVPDYLWYRQAAATRAQQQAQPPVEINSVEVDGNLLKAQVQVRPSFNGNSIQFVLAAPAGDVVSASMVAQEFYEPFAADPAQVKSSGGGTSSANAPRPHTAMVRHLAYVKGHRLLRVQVPAVVSGAVGSRLKSGELTIKFANPISITENATPSSAAESIGPIAAMLQKFVANPDDLDRFQVPLAEVPAPGEYEYGPPLGYTPDAVARFETTENGFVRFSGADLAASGVDIGAIDKSRVSIWSNGEQQPINVSGVQGGGVVTPADQFTIYARENLSTYTATRVYWVRTDVPALPMVQLEPAAGIAGAPGMHFRSNLTIEQDLPPVLTRNDQFLSILDYRWVWWTWTESGADSEVPSPRTYDEPGEVAFDLPGLTPAAGATPITLSFYAHHWRPENAPIPVTIQVNDQTTTRIEVSETSGLKQTISIPTSYLRATSNTIVLTPEVTTGTMALPDLCFDRLEIAYPRAYEMTSQTLEFHPPSNAGGIVTINPPSGATEPLLIADITTTATAILATSPNQSGPVSLRAAGPASRRYIAVLPKAIRPAKLVKVEHESDLRSPDNRGDLIVIAWPDFIKEMKPWVDRKTSAGHTVKVVSVHDVYDQFGYGHASPYAIRDFLRYAAMHWQAGNAGSAASTVLLVGDSTSAYRNEFRNDVINYVPTMRLSVGGDVFASDQWYVGLFGDDVFADALIGRFSVNSVKDLRNVIKKQLDYENNTAPAPWQNTLGFIADHSEFEDSVDRVMQQVVPPRFFMDRIMMSELQWIDNYYFPKEIAEAQQAKVSPAATGRIRDMFNRGAAVVTYFGHGSPNIWSTERMWFGGDSPNSDNLLLTNRDRLSIVINMTCNSGAIDYPQPRWNVCISEDFMRVPNGGAVACFVPSGPGLTVQHERLMLELGKCLFGNDTEPLGHSMQLGLWRYLAEGNPPELARMYILLGDPLLMPHISKPMPAAPEVVSTATHWPGTVLLPPDIVAAKTGGNYQLETYGDHIDPGAISAFTSSTVALPLPAQLPAVAKSAQSLAFSVPGMGATTGTVSTFLPISPVRAVDLLQWRRIDNQSEPDATAVLDLRLRNSSPLPLRDLQVEIISDTDGKPAGKSQPVTLPAFADENIRVDVPVSPGLKYFRVIVTNGTARRNLQTEVPLAIAGLRPDDKRGAIPPAIVDPRSVTVRYRRSAIGITATVSCWIYALAREPLSNLRIGIQGPDGLMIQESTVTVPPIGPGENAQIAMNVELTPGAPTLDYGIRFDPTGLYPEFTRFPMEHVKLGQMQFSDLVVKSVRPSSASPTDGQTVFFDVTVANEGRARVDSVRVEGFENTSSGTEKLKSQVMLEPPLFTLDPGTSHTTRLRWDPFENAGENQLRFTAGSVYDTPDSHPENNSMDLALDVRTKARLVPVKVGPIRPTAEDIAARQVRFLARVRNDGESEIHGLRVLFYSSPDMSDEAYLGDAELDSVAPGQTRDVIFTYKFKPEEIHRPINITFEVMYKGSRQRLLH